MLTFGFKCVCLRKERVLGSWRAKALRNLTNPTGREVSCGDGQPSSPLFPQHHKPAKEAVLPDESLPTGKRLPELPVQRNWQSVPSVDLLFARARSRSCFPSHLLHGHPNWPWKGKPCQPRAVPVSLSPGAVPCSASGFYFQLCSPAFLNSAVMWTW